MHVGRRDGTLINATGQPLSFGMNAQFFRDDGVISRRPCRVPTPSTVRNGDRPRRHRVHRRRVFWAGTTADGRAEPGLGRSGAGPARCGPGSAIYGRSISSTARRALTLPDPCMSSRPGLPRSSADRRRRASTAAGSMATPLRPTRSAATPLTCGRRSGRRCPNGSPRRPRS